jgi:hypothetical protein
MIWLAPAAWIGLVVLAVPVLVHLLSRDRARRYRFPSLRFLDVARLTPTQRTRLTDPWLLLLRCAILALAVAAVARPLWRTAARDTALADWMSRAVIVDTSLSVRHTLLGGERALDVARRTGALLADSANTALVIETGRPHTAITGAITWLLARGGRGELVIVSDLQRGVLSDADLARVPTTIGVRFVPLVGTRETIAAESGPGVMIVGAELSAAGSDGLRQMAAPFADEPMRPPFPVRVHLVPDGADTRDVAALTRPELELLRRMERDPFLMYPLQPARSIGDTLELLVPVREPRDDRAAATLIAAWRSISDPLAVFEADTATIPDATVRRWTREPVEGALSPAAAHRERSDARVLWTAVLALLAIEALARRPRSVASAADARS